MLNWFLAIFISFFTLNFSSWVSHDYLFPLLYWRLLGLGYFLFASWQLYTLLKGPFKRFDYIFSAWLAIIPTILTASLLIIFNNRINLIAKILAWSGNVYMIFLTFLYFHVAKK